MKTALVEKRVGCVQFACQILGDKWTPMIIRCLCNGPQRFSLIQVEAGGVNPRTLSARLRSLQQQDIITRTVHAEVPPRTEYELTDKGQDLIPILQQMAEWGDKYAQTAKG